MHRLVAIGLLSFLAGGCAMATCPDDECEQVTALDSCDDQILNGSETGVDCGGDDCAPCALDAGPRRCDEHRDCESGLCVGDVCALPACRAGDASGDCTAVTWQLGDMSSCSAQCGGGEREAAVACLGTDPTGATFEVPGDWCETTEPRPVLREACNPDPCCEVLTYQDLRNWNGGQHVEFYHPDEATGAQLCSELTERPFAGIDATMVANQGGWAGYSNLSIERYSDGKYRSKCDQGKSPYDQCVGRPYIAVLSCCHAP